MSKPRRMLPVSSEDIESAVLYDGLRLLAQVEIAGRRRVLAYWSARAETLPLIDPRGEVLDEHPVDDDPPMIKFLHEKQLAEA